MCAVTKKESIKPLPCYPDKWMYKLVEKEAAEKRVSMAWLIRDIVRKYYEQSGNS